MFCLLVLGLNGLALTGWEGKVANKDDCGSESYRFGCRMLYLVCKR
jgi:hypothetical protein